MKTKFYLFAAMCCMVMGNAWARSYEALDSIPAEVYLKDLRYDKQTKELQFKDLFHADKYLDRIYGIYVFARDEETTFYKDHGFFPHDTYMYGYCKDGAHYSSEINFTNIGMGYCCNYTATDMTGGAKYTDGLFNGSKKFPTFKAILDSCLKRGYPSIRVAICPQYERKAAIEDYNIRVSYYNPEGGLGAYDTQKWLINYVDIDLDVDPTNEVIVPEEVKFGEFYDVKRVIAAAGVTDYKFQESSDNIKWHTIKSGQLNAAQARHGDTLSVELALDAYRVGKAAAYYRSIATNVKTGKADTSAVKKVTYLYKARFEGEGETAEVYLPAGTETELSDPAEEPCVDYAFTSDLPVQTRREKGDIIVTMPACNLIIAQVTPKYTVKFLNADYTLLKTEEVVCGEAATAPATPSMEGMTFKQWSRDFSNVTKNMTVMAQYEMGDDYFFYDIMTSHTNDRYKAPDFAGSTKRAMIGDSLTFTAEIRTPQESTLRYQQGLRDKDGNWTWGDPKTIGTYTAANVASGESKTFTLKVAAAYEYGNEMAFRYGEAYRFNLYCAGATLLSEPYEFDIYYPLTIMSKIKESETIHGDPIYEGLTFENANGDMGWSALSPIFPARYGEKVRIYRDNGGVGACMKFARVNRPESYNALETGEDKKGTYIVAPGEKETVNVTVSRKAVVFDGAKPTQSYDFSAQGLGKYYAYYAEVVNCGGSIQNVPADPVSDGYIFKGWASWDKSSYDSLAYLNIPAISDIFIGFSAIWEAIPVIKTYTVKFFEKDGITQIGADQIVNEGEDAVPPTAPEVEGFDFICWDKPYTTITADVNITAVYGEEKIWTVTYYDEDGITKLGEEQVSDGLSAKGTTLSKFGYNFLGWFDKNGDPAIFTIKEDVSFFAKWEALPTSGICGANLFWAYDSEKQLLSITGDGDMYNYDDEKNNAPWAVFIEKIQQVSLPDGLTSIGNYAFIYFQISSIDIPNTVTSIGEIAFGECMYITKLILPENLTTIGDGAFIGTGITEISIPKGVTKIPYGAFADCLFLTKIEFPDNLKIIGEVAFAECKSLKNLIIPEGVSLIEERAFYACEGLTSVILPSTLTTLEDKAFSGCTALEKVTNNAVIPQEINANVFEDVDITKCKLYVAGSAIEAYKEATVWKDFDIQGIPRTVTFVDYDDNMLKEDIVPDGSAATAPDDPEREGYTFTGWDPADFSHVTSDLTVTATYSIKTYTVTFVDWDEKVLKTQTVDWNTAATAPEDPEREGYTFTGWDPADFSHITSDLTVTAQYKENPGTGVDEIVNRKSSNRKLIIDGVLYIEHNGKILDATGRLVKE